MFRAEWTAFGEPCLCKNETATIVKYRSLSVRRERNYWNAIIGEGLSVSGMIVKLFRAENDASLPPVNCIRNKGGVRFFSTKMQLVELF